MPVCGTLTTEARSTPRLRRRVCTNGSMSSRSTSPTRRRSNGESRRRRRSRTVGWTRWSPTQASGSPGCSRTCQTTTSGVCSRRTSLASRRSPGRACPVMRARRRGRFLVVSSNSAFTGAPAASAYHASKWAVEGWAESVAYEVKPFGIDVVLVEPGSFKTEIWGKTSVAKPAGSAYAGAHKLIDDGIAKLQGWGATRRRSPTSSRTRSTHAGRGCATRWVRTRSSSTSWCAGSCR